jgi:hypothetical protein
VGQTFGMMIGRRASPVWASTHVCSVTCGLNVSATRNNEGPSIKPALATKKNPKRSYALGVLSCCLNLGSWPGGGVSGGAARSVFKREAWSFAAHWTRRPRGGRRDPYKPLPRSPADAGDRDDGCEQPLPHLQSANAWR